MDVDWYKCSGGVWCELNKLDLSHKYLQGISGVYILWSGSNPRSVLTVGFGDIAEEFSALKKDLAIMAFAHLGLFVTWAEVSMLKRKGVMRYLNDTLNPKIKSQKTDGSSVEVNLPW